MNLKKLIGSFDFKKFSKASRTDFGVLATATGEKMFLPNEMFEFNRTRCLNLTE